jgi:hypothetical protein
MSRSSSMSPTMLVKDSSSLQYPIILQMTTRLDMIHLRAIELSSTRMFLLKFRVSFKCPQSLQDRKIHASSHLEDGMLAALVGQDQSDGSLSTTFFTFGLKDSTYSARASRGEFGRGMLQAPVTYLLQRMTSLAGVHLRFVQHKNADDIRRILSYANGVLKGRFYLVEFPGLLPVGFSYYLERLQEQIHSNQFPFAEYIAPPLHSSTPAMQPPAYALDPTFSYDLTLLADSETKRGVSPIRIRASLDKDRAKDEEIRGREFLRQYTALDAGQSDALLKSLQRRLAFTHGSPGTGKTYLGVAIVKTILAS